MRGLRASSRARRGELRDSCEQLTAASLALSSAAADNAEKDTVLSSLNVKIAELEGAMKREAARRPRTSPRRSRRAPRRSARTHRWRVLLAARAGAAHKHAAHKRDPLRGAAGRDSAAAAAEEAAAARADASELLGAPPRRRRRTRAPAKAGRRRREGGGGARLEGARRWTTRRRRAKRPGGAQGG